MANDYSCANWDRLCDHLKDVFWEDIFKLSASAAAKEFCKGFQIGIDIFVPYWKYRVMSHSSPWFLVACASAIVHRNHFRFHQKDECSESKVKFRQISNCYKIALEPAKMAYANKIKDSTTSQKFGSQNFWQMANSALK